MVTILALSACQLTLATPGVDGRTPTPANQRTQVAAVTATISSVVSLVAKHTMDQADQTTPVVVTVTPESATTPTATPGKSYQSTERLAEAYLTHLVAGNREEVFSLLSGGVICTPSNFRENVERHLDRFSTSQVRKIMIEVEAGSPTMHGQHSEVANISFEFKKGNSSDWRQVTIWIATQFRGSSTQRGICDVSRIDVQ